MKIADILSELSSAILHRKLIVDPKIPFGYFVMECFRKSGMLLCGIIRFREFGVFLSPRAKIRCRSKFTFGRGILIEEDVIINALSDEGVIAGGSVSICKRTIIECTGSIRSLGKGLRLGDRVGIGSSSFLGCAGGIEIGDDTILGNFVSMHSENHRFDLPDVPIRMQGVTHEGIKIGRGCWIGAKVTILDGVEIGDLCVVAAGAVVVKGKYPDRVVLGGVPAKIIRKATDFDTNLFAEQV
jgi:acetyltransferase-like isoleucine patch superfamily enzyme